MTTQPLPELVNVQTVQDSDTNEAVETSTLNQAIIEEIIAQTQQLQQIIALHDTDPIRASEAKTSLSKVNALYQNLLIAKEENNLQVETVI